MSVADVFDALVGKSLAALILGVGVAQDMQVVVSAFHH